MLTEHKADEALRPSTKAWLAIAGATAVAFLLALALVLGLGASRQLLVELPAAVIAVALLAFNTHWALCFAAFAIMPLGDVRREILDVTFNFPELLIFAICAKEFLLFLRRRETLKPYLPLAPIAIFLATAFLGVVTGFMNGTAPKHILQDFRQFSEFIVLFVLIVQRVERREQVMHLLASFTLGAALIAIHGIVQRYTGIGISGIQLQSDLFHYNAIRSGSFYGATALGGLMVLAVGPAIGVALTTKNRALTLTIGMCVVLCLLVMIFTKTRASWLAMALTLVYIVAFTRPAMRTIALAAIGVLFFAALVGPTVVQRMSTLSAPKSDQSLMDRAQYYTAASYIARAHPVLGLGWGCYYDIDDILAHEAYVVTPRPPAAPDSTVHSAYLQLLVKSGLVGLLGFLGMVFVWFERVWSAQRTASETTRDHVLTVCIAGGVFGYLAHSAFENFFQWAVMAQSFWLLLGVSYVMAHLNAPAQRQFRVPLLVSGIVGAGFLAFMLACVRLESFHTDYYERNVARALEAGNTEKALDIAKRAAKRRYEDPMAATVYARVLLETGDTEAGLEEMQAAFLDHSYRVELGFTDTGPPFYFAPARLTLGRYYLEQGDSHAAVNQFELARAYANLADEQYAAFHDALYQAYAAEGLWSRALTYHAPSAADLEQHPADDALAVARAAEGAGQWETILLLSETLLSGDADPGAVNYLIGRARLANGQTAAATVHLEIAAGRHYPGAAYFFGLALETQGETGAAASAYALAPPGDPYRVFALARANEIRSPGNGSATTTPVSETLAAMTPLPGRDSTGPGSSWQPVAYAPPAGGIPRDGRFPMLLLWEDGEAAEAPLGATRLECDTDEPHLWLGPHRLLALTWTENQLDTRSFDVAPPGAIVFPGWTDGMREWFEQRDTTAMEAVPVDDGQALRITARDWIYSVPVRVEAGEGYMLMGRVNAGAGAVCWQALDDDAGVLFSEYLPHADTEGAWTRVESYQVALPGWHTLRLMLTCESAEEPAQFDDLALWPVALPTLPDATGDGTAE